MRQPILAELGVPGCPYISCIQTLNDLFGVESPIDCCFSFQNLCHCPILPKRISVTLSSILDPAYLTTRFSDMGTLISLQMTTFGPTISETLKCVCVCVCNSYLEEARLWKEDDYTRPPGPFPGKVTVCVLVRKINATPHDSRASLWNPEVGSGPGDMK